MSDAHIDPSLRLGAYRIDDLHRTLGFPVWFLDNIAGDEVSVPLMTDMLLAAHTAGLAEVDDVGDHEVYYSRKPLLGKANFVPRLARDEAQRLLDEVLACAERNNASPSSEFQFRRIAVFGSFLTDRPTLGDLDIGAEAAYSDTGDIVNEPSKYPFRGRCDFDRWASILKRKSPRQISVHDIREMKAIGASHRVVWEFGKGRVNEPMIASTSKVGDTVPDPLVRRARSREEQRVMDSLAARTSSIATWPRAIEVDLTGVKCLSLALYREEIKSPLLLGLAHLRLLPNGCVRDAVAAGLEPLYAALSASKRQRIDRLILPVIKSSIVHGKWSLRANGRVLKSSGT